MLAYSTMFCTMFDLNTMDYIMDTSNSEKITHHLGNHLNVERSTNVCVKCYSHMPLLISNPGENIEGENLSLLYIL